MKTKKCEEKCPNCGSDNFAYDASEVIDNTLRYSCVCLDCLEVFDEDYDIVYSETIQYGTIV